MDQKQKVYDRLMAMGISFEVQEHPAVYTIAEMETLGITLHGEVCKNLFLRDNKGKRHFLVVVQKDKQTDLRVLQEKLECTKLGFASAERLEKYLGLRQGEVSPLGLFADTEHAVELVMDHDLAGYNWLGVHPNDNTATLWISYADILRVARENGNVVHVIDW